MTEKIYLGVNTVTVGGVAQSVMDTPTKLDGKYATTIILKINSLAYDGVKLYHYSAYVTYFGSKTTYKAGDYLIAAGSLKTVRDSSGAFKTTVHAKTIYKVFNDPDAIAEKRYGRYSLDKEPIQEPPDLPEDAELDF